MKHTLSQLIQAAQREVEMRKKVYPGLVAKGSMTNTEAKEETLAMQNIVKALQQMDMQQRGVFSTANTPAQGDVQRYMMHLHPRHHKPLAEQYQIVDPVITATYISGYLDGLENLSALTERHPNPRLNLQAATNTAVLKLLEGSADESWTYTPIDTMAVDQKIAAFCLAYERAHQAKYKVGPYEAAAWKGKYAEVEARAEDLDYYMGTTAYPLNSPKTIENYLRYANQIGEIRRSSEQTSSSHKFTLPPTTERLAKCKDPQEREAYIAFLIEHGYRVRRIGEGQQRTIVELAEA